MKKKKKQQDAATSHDRKEEEHGTAAQSIVCKACGKQGHSRTSSASCDLYKPRQGAKKPDLDESEGADVYLKKQILVYKQGLNTFTRHKFRNGETLIDRIHQQVAMITKNAFYATRILNYHLQRCIEQKLELPDVFSDKWIRQIFTRNIKDEDLKKSLDDIRTTIPELEKGVISQINTIFSQEYVVNMQVHLDTVYDKMHRNWMKHILVMKGIGRKGVGKLVAWIMENPEQSIAAFPKLVGIWMEHASTSSRKLQQMYHLNHLFTCWGLKLYNLAPQYTTNAKYITVDTDTLYYLLKNDLPSTANGKRMTITEFGTLREDRWKQYTNIKNKYFSDQKRFNCMIKTDGVGCSVVLFQWNKVQKEKKSEEQKREAKQQCYEAKLAAVPNEANARIVGCDPGRKDLLSASDEAGNRYVLTNKRYYRDCKFVERRNWKVKQLQRLHIYPFLLKMETSKTYDSAHTLFYLQYLLDNKDKMNLLFELELYHRTRKKRWRSYIHKQKTLDQFCLSMIDGQKENTIFAYGDASYCHNNKGYAPSLKGNWIKHRLEKVHNAHLLMTREYNTSQVCSSCQHDRKLVSLGSKYDPRQFDFTRSRPAQKHFVRRCTNCLIIWNRDLNASRNMIYLCRQMLLGLGRPALFSQSLKKPDLIGFPSDRNANESRMMNATDITVGLANATIGV